MRRDRILTLLVLVLIVASIVAFVWWRSTKTLMDRDHPDAMAVLVAISR